jgi:RNA-dependent RNA polymerase
MEVRVRLILHRPEFTGFKDKAIVNWAPSIVDQFQPPRVVDKPDGLEEQNFEKDVESVTSFHSRLACSTRGEAHKLFLRAILRSLDDDNIAKYSAFHKCAAYSKGYSHPETIRLAYMWAQLSFRRQNLMSCRFTTCLDSRKTGHRVLREVLTADSKQYGWPLPVCLRNSVDDEGRQGATVKRGAKLAPFILEALQRFGEAVADNLLAKYKKLSDPLPGMRSGLWTQDGDLLKPYQHIVEKLSEMESLHADEFLREARRELKMVEDHVKTRQEEWPMAFRTRQAPSRINAEVAALKQRFASGPDVPHLSLLGDIPAIRASYAYQQCRPKNTHFAFAMALEELCRIKAQELEGAILDRELAELMAIPKSTVRALSAARPSI